MRPPHAAAEKLRPALSPTRRAMSFNEAAARGGGKGWCEDGGMRAAGASMRPPHAAAEKRDQGCRDSRRCRASMRPPHAAAEKRSCRVAMGKLPSCFNEAAARGGGKAYPKFPGSTEAPGFNEAAARGGGKAPRQSLRHLHHGSFNEAAARGGGKVQVHAEDIIEIAPLQ